MTTLLVFFVISVIGMVILVLIRFIELKTGRNIISENFRDTSDRKLIIIWNKINKFFLKKKNQLRNFIDMIPVFFARLIYIGLKWVRRKGDKFFNMIKGKGTITNRGSASFFLSSINNHKNNNK